MISKPSVVIPIITPFSRCSAIGPSAIIIKPKRSSGHGIYSSRNGACPRTDSTRPFTSTTMTPSACGRRSAVCPPNASAASVRRKISGKWARLVPAVHAAKFIWIAGPKRAIGKMCRDTNAGSTATARATSSCGIWFLSNTTAKKIATWKIYRRNMSIPAWGSSASQPCCRTCCRITTSIICAR